MAEVHFLEPVAPSEDGRRRMAETCRERIIAAMAALSHGGRQRYRPPRWLRNPHLQSVLSSMPLRRAAGQRALAAHRRTAPANTSIEVERRRAPARLPQPGARPAPAAAWSLLLHGWEGSSESSYMRHTAAHLLADGFDVFRLNFRDHGDTHHLNEGLFHSCRLEEVVQAAAGVVDAVSGAGRSWPRVIRWAAISRCGWRWRRPRPASRWCMRRRCARRWIRRR